MTNSRDKGARGEREFAKYLRSLGFPSTIRGQQRSGVEQADVICDELPNVHFEVKFGYPISTFDMGLSLFDSAIEQAKSDAGARYPVIAWKPKGKRKDAWRLTEAIDFGTGTPTIMGSKQIKKRLQQLNLIKEW